MNLKTILDLISFIETDVFIESSSDNMFNQYKDNIELDKEGGNFLRQKNLKNFINAIGYPVMFIVGEAPGWRGCRFSGVPFTSERQLLGTISFFGLVSSTYKPPMEEVSATVFWRVMKKAGMHFFTWNSVPFHPYMPGNPTSNRKPTYDEIDKFSRMLPIFENILNPSMTIAVGRKAQEALELQNIKCRYVRHPARGGEVEFEEGMIKIFKSLPELMES